MWTFYIADSSRSAHPALCAGGRAELQLPLRYNIAPTQDVAVVRQTNGGRQLSMMHWGLIPFWATDPGVGSRMINARCETAAEKPAFRVPMRSRRCLIAADGFLEWQKQGKRKQPFYFRRRDDQPFAFAGLWDRWTKGGQAEEIDSCTILTTDADELVRPLHDRMPVILSPKDYDAWLNPDETDPAALNYLLQPYPVDELIAYPVNPVVNNARSDSPSCLEELEVNRELF